MDSTITRPGVSIVVGVNMIEVGRVVTPQDARAIGQTTRTARVSFQAVKKYLSTKRLRRPARLTSGE